MHVMRSGVAALLSVAVCLPMAARAANSGWYVAADGGQSSFNDIGNQIPVRVTALPFLAQGSGSEPVKTQFTSVTVTSNKNHHGAYRLTLGYQFNPYWGIEASYVDLGKTTTAGSASGYYLPPCQPAGICLPAMMPLSLDYRASYSVRGPAMAFTGTYPITDRWSVFGRLGMIDARVHLALDASPTSDPLLVPSAESDSSTSWSSTFGLGVSWALDDRWDVRLDWDDYVDVGSRNSTGRNSVSLASLGVVYRI